MCIATTCDEKYSQPMAVYHVKTEGYICHFIEKCSPCNKVSGCFFFRFLTRYSVYSLYIETQLFQIRTI